MRAHKDKGLRLRLVEAENNIGVKRNAGAFVAAGSVLLFLDDDMRVASGFVSRHANAHARDGSADIVCGDVHFPSEWVEASNYYRYKQGRHQASVGLPSNSLPPHRIVTMNMSMSTQLFSSLGGFRTDFPQYGQEDLEFGFRAVRSGCTIELSQEASASHIEVGQDWRTFAAKVYCSTFYGSETLLKVAPEAANVPTFLYSEKFPSSRRVGIVRGVLSFVGSSKVLRLGIKYADKLDRIRWAYVSTPYAILILAVARRGATDRLRGAGDRRSQLFGER